MRWNFECSIVIVTLLVLMLKDRVKELSNLGFNAYAIGTGDEEVFANNSSSVGDRMVSESFGSLLPRTNKQFLVLKELKKETTGTLLHLRISS